jgi:hypothetical protein
MSESIRLFVAAEDCPSDRTDAAPGIMPPPPRDTTSPQPPSETVWLLSAYEHGREFLGWSTSRQILDDFVSRRGYSSTTIRRLDTKNQVTTYTSPPSPRDHSIGALHLDYSAAGILIAAGIRTLGQMADMSIETFRRLGLKPPHHRRIQKDLAQYGLKMSFELFPGEQRGWSPKRRSA